MVGSSVSLTSAVLVFGAEAPPFTKVMGIPISMKSTTRVPSFRVPVLSMPSIVMVMFSPFRAHVPSAASPSRVMTHLPPDFSST